MPLTAKGEKIHRQMVEDYGPEKAERVFYASKNAGTISGVDAGDTEGELEDLRAKLSDAQESALNARSVAARDGFKAESDRLTKRIADMEKADRSDARAYSIGAEARYTRANEQAAEEAVRKAEAAAEGGHGMQRAARRKELEDAKAFREAQKKNIERFGYKDAKADDSRADTVHRDYSKVKHIASVEAAARKYREEARNNGWGPNLKPFEEALNREVEKAIAPKGDARADTGPDHILPHVGKDAFYHGPRKGDAASPPTPLEKMEAELDAKADGFSGSPYETSREREAIAKRQKEGGLKQPKAEKEPEREKSWTETLKNKSDASPLEKAEEKAKPGGYNREAVQKAIERDPRIKGKEAAKIHALLKGWRGDAARPDASPLEKAEAQIDEMKLHQKLGDAFMAHCDEIERRLDTLDGMVRAGEKADEREAEKADAGRPLVR